MYQVIARKYRPQTFEDVVSQEHVKTTLENAIAQKRIAHGYIFSGQRGTGKTTVARILARCLNCVGGPTVKPCGECASCREITAGGTVDVIEIDAASNRGINEMRELRENVRYQPARDRYKVFIIDEAHQITSEAFNALLKTIEEPPPWAVFVLCTTEAHKIPATIASRCQHFSFRSVDFEDLVARMQWICEQEGVAADADALAVLAQAGEGSVRDSLSALDQAIACCGATLAASEVRALLGAFALESLEHVTIALAEQNSARMLELVDELERNGHNLQHFSRELSRYFRNLLVARIAGSGTRLIAASAAQRRKLAEIAARFSEEDLTRYLALSLELFRDLQFSLQPRFHLELGLLRLVQAGKLISIEEALANLPAGATSLAATSAAVRPTSERSEFRAPASVAKPNPPNLASPAPASVASHDPNPRPSTPGPGERSESSSLRERLHAAFIALGMQFHADAIEQSRVEEFGQELVFTTPKEYARFLAPNDLNKAFRHLGEPPRRVRVELGEVQVEAVAQAAQEDDTAARALANPEVQRYRELFGGEVRAVRSLKE